MGGDSPLVDELASTSSAIPELANNYLERVMFGRNYSYTIPYALIGHIKIVNDGYIWGGYQYNSILSN